MKNFARIWPLLLLVLPACRKTAPVFSADAWAEYTKAYNFLNKQNDSAFFYFNKLASNSKDISQVASAYQSMAFIQGNAGDTYGAQESLTLSLKALDEHEPENKDAIARTYNGLGMTYSDLSAYRQALNYYHLALSFVKDTQLKANILNNEGNAYKDLKTYAVALQSYTSAIRLVGDSGATYARILNNRALTRWLADPHYNAAPEMMQALHIRVKEKDIAGQNSSFAHLAEYYLTNQPDSARAYAQKMLQVAGRLQNGDDQLFALRKLISLSSGLPAQRLFQRYQAVEDSVQTKRNAAKNQFAVIRYNVEKAKTENLELQKKNEEKRYQLIGVLVLTGLGIVFFFWWYRKRKQRLKAESDNELRQAKLQLSQKVHDRVANGVYRIMNEVEHNRELQQDDLLDRLEDVYKVSRNIAHDDDELAEEFSERINVLLNAFKRATVRLAVTGNEETLWQSVNVKVKDNLELILQELMVNMSKHSMATQARIAFNKDDGKLIIDYLDNGIGLPENKKNGKGMKNTVSRMVALDGYITFDNQATGGLHIRMEVPMN